MGWGAQGLDTCSTEVTGFWTFQCWPEKDQMSRIIATTTVVAGLISASRQPSRSLHGAL